MPTFTANASLTGMSATFSSYVQASTTSLRRGGPRPHEERTEYWLQYFRQLQQGPAVLLRMNLDGLIEHEVKARYIRNDETMIHALQRHARKLTAMHRALVALGSDELAPFLNDVLRQLMQVVGDSTLTALRSE